MSKTKRNLAAAIGLAISMLTVACTSTAPTPTVAPSTKASPTSAPAKASPTSAPAKSTGSPAAAGDVSQGKAVFTNKCAGCHGQNAEGGVGPDLRKVGSTRDRDYLTRFVSDPQAAKPGAGMPKISLSQAELTAVVDYLVTLK